MATLATFAFGIAVASPLWAALYLATRAWLEARRNSPDFREEVIKAMNLTPEEVARIRNEPVR